MNGFIVFLFLIFFVGPIFKKIFGKSPAKKKNWGRTHEQIKAQSKKYGHSGATNRVHKRLHKQDGSEAFPEEHQAHVKARDIRDQLENSKMERTIHGKANRGIIRAGNKGRSDWGTRVHGGSINSLILLLGLAAAAYIIASGLGSKIIDLV